MVLLPLLLLEYVDDVKNVLLMRIVRKLVVMEQMVVVAALKMQHADDTVIDDVDLVDNNNDNGDNDDDNDSIDL